MYGKLDISLVFTPLQWVGVAAGSYSNKTEDTLDSTFSNQLSSVSPIWQEWKPATITVFLQVRLMTAALRDVSLVIHLMKMFHTVDEKQVFFWEKHSGVDGKS